MPAALVARRVFALVLFAAALVLAVQVVADLNRVKELKSDLAELRNVRYGLLDPDEWLARVAGIVERRVESFELTEANRPQIKRAVEQVLDTLLTQLEDYLRRRNLGPNGSWMDQLRGIAQQAIQEVFVDFEKLRKRVPEYADAVLEELSKPEAKREIKAQLLKLLHAAAASTFAKTDRTRLDAVLASHGCRAPADCVETVAARIAAYRRPVLYRLSGVFGLVIALFALCLAAPGRQPPARDAGGATAAPAGPPGPGDGRGGFDPFRLFLLTGATLILLAGGVLTPMIEIEARIDRLAFELFAEPVVFTNQVLYFQTKSVFDVVAILARTGKPDMLLVGALIVAFSVIFPALKVLATYVYYYDLKGLRRSAAVRFFALKSGKWSMADVFVIAIFMAYIGFSGLIGSQLGTLEQAARQVQVLTTDGTGLAPGFFLFLAFVIASMVLSTVLEARIGEEHAT